MYTNNNTPETYKGHSQQSLRVINTTKGTDNMLSRPVTKLALNADDIAAYEQRKAARDAAKSDAMDDSKTSSQEGPDVHVFPASSAKTAKSKMTREQRIGVGNSRG